MGRELQVRSRASVEAVKEVESFVNDKLTEVAAAARNCDAQGVAILALMNIAEAYLELQKEHNLSRQNEQEKVSRLLRQMELAMPESN
jgi:cell division protein ZapA (FtsZ GTPase activity inhibitor)